ncbi:MAG: molybdopterin molybdotransferase MoeA [Cyclobacteriaceae bacterium]
MVNVREAVSIVQSHRFKPQTEDVEIADCINRVLNEKVVADRDFPPFDRVAMDGFAIQFASFESGCAQFKVEGIAAAGQPQSALAEQTSCIEVMTGSSLPLNTDTVVRYEDVDIKDGRAIIKSTKLVKGQNIHAQASDARQSDTLLTPGTVLSPIEVALIATIGKPRVKVKSLPSFAIISTGDELVDIHETPHKHQIRRSNSYTLQAALQALNCKSTLHHLPDNKEKLSQELHKILDAHDVIILSGGVSKGKFDYVPEVLEQLGVKKHFHKVKQKPGKPFWFGSTQDKTVFALPGNPVSTTVCFYKYIRPWIWHSLGVNADVDVAALGVDFNFPAPLTYFLEVQVKNEGGRLIAYPKQGGGSGDFANLKEVNAFMELPEEVTSFKKGETYPIYLFR